MWQDLAVAFSLLLVLEGLLPFLSPALLRRCARVLGEADDRFLRLVGLASMLAGIGLLYMINP